MDVGFSSVEVVVWRVGLRFPGWVREMVILVLEASRVKVGSQVDALKVIISWPTVKSSLIAR